MARCIATTVPTTLARTVIGMSEDESDRTRISDIVEDLETIRKEHGDLPILISRSAGDSVCIEIKDYSHPPGTSAVIGLCHEDMESDRNE